MGLATRPRSAALEAAPHQAPAPRASESAASSLLPAVEAPTPTPPTPPSTPSPPPRTETPAHTPTASVATRFAVSGMSSEQIRNAEIKNNSRVLT